MKRKIVIIVGRTGQLSRCLVEQWRSKPEINDAMIVVPVSSKSFDITDEDKVRMGIGSINPDVIINTAAIHDLKQCDDDPAAALEVNAVGPRHLAEHAPSGVPIIQISTDYVFDGVNDDQPYTETDICNPLNTYGKTKLIGEETVLDRDAGMVVRTASLWSEFGSVRKGGRNFVTTMMNLASGYGSIDVVENIFMTPTSAHDLAMSILYMIVNDIPLQGVVNMVNMSPPISWYEFATMLFHEAGMPATADRVKPIQSPSLEDRPMFSALDDSKLNEMGYGLPNLTSSLRAFFSERGAKLAETHKGGTSL